jgi:hypothetical protein
MSREITRKIVEDIYSDTYVSLKEDVSKAISEKAVSVLEDMKSHVAKRFFTEATFGVNPQGGDVVDTPDGGKAQQQPYSYKGIPKYTSQDDSKPTADSTTQTPSVRTQQSPNYPVYPKDSDAAKDFRSAFRDARTRGDKEFTWQGRKYGTELAKPQTTPGPQNQTRPTEPSMGQKSIPAPQAQAPMPRQQSIPAPQAQAPMPRQQSIPAPQAQAPGQQPRPAPSYIGQKQGLQGFTNLPASHSTGPKSFKQY